MGGRGGGAQSMTGDLSILVAFAGGLFSFLSPCVLPLFPSYLSFITGMSVAQLQSASSADGERWRILAHSLAFVLGFSMVFVGMGASFSAVGQALFDYRDQIRLAGGILIIVFGLYVVGVLRIGFLGRYHQLQLRSKPAGLLGSWLVGVTFAIGWTPCVGPILGAILSLAGTAETVSSGVTLLSAYSAGLALPFVLSSLALGAFLATFRRFRPWIVVVERTAGVLLVIVGLLVATNYFLVLNAYALSLTPRWLLERL
jgi:cytochrome c-type biogenesis protein